MKFPSPIPSCSNENLCFHVGDYSFGFNGQEKDDEMWGGSESYSFEFRVHSPRLGRFLSIDPLNDDYPWNSTYAFAENRVVDGVDLEGREWSVTTHTDETTGATVHVLHCELKVVNSASLLTDAQISLLMDEVDKELSATFTQFDASTNTQYEVEMCYDIVSSSEGQTGLVIELVPTPPSKDGLVQLGEAIVGQTQNQVLKLSCGDKENILTIPVMARTAVHELGHTLGLDHPHVDRQTQKGVNRYNSPNMATNESTPDVFNQYKKCMDYLKSPNPKLQAPDMTIMENFMMQSVAIDEIQTHYGKESAKKEINISSENPRTGATNDQCARAVQNILKQQPTK